MNIQNTRLKLQKKFASLNSVSWEEFDPELRRFIRFLADNQTLASAIQQLLAEFPNLSSEMEAFLANDEGISGETHAESAAIAYYILRKVSEALPSEHGNAFVRFVEYTTDFHQTLNNFRRKYLRPFYEELDERLSDANVILGEMLRLKQTIEWFKREEFYGIYSLETRKGEKRLAWKTYELLYERGLDFSIEPTSVSGAADMVAAQNSSNPLVADVKVYDPAGSRGASYIKKGVSQVFTYLEDFNQTIGYLLIYGVTEGILRIPDLTTDSVPSITTHGKTIFLIQIDIFLHTESASIRQPSVENVALADFLRQIEEDLKASEI